MFEPILKEIKERNAKKIAVQLPEGLKPQAIGLVEKIEKTGAKVFVLADSCFGACDLRDSQAAELGCDLLIHFGHSEIPMAKTKVSVLFVEFPSELIIERVIEKAANEIQHDKIGVITTVQYLPVLDKARKILEKYGKKTFIGKNSGRAKHTGQILGCDYSAATTIAEKIDCFLYIGTGNFHPLGVALATDKKVFVADPEKNEIKDIEELKDEFLRKRFARIEAAKKAKKFGILLSLKPGQRREKLALAIKEILEKNKKEAVVLAVDDVANEKLIGFGLECYVDTACPRIATDDFELYEKPVLTYYELEIALGKREWKDYKVDVF